jgi:hypothetical protein
MRITSTHSWKWLAASSLIVLGTACTATTTSNTDDDGGTTDTDGGTNNNDGSVHPNDSSTGNDSSNPGNDSSSPGNDSGATNCNTVAQTGCPAGKQCTLNSANQTVCVTAGTVASGAVCGMTAGQCVPGDICVGASATATLTCHEFCATDSDCKGAPLSAGNGPACAIGLDMTNTNKVCTNPCNPVAAAGASMCPTGLSCIWGQTMTVGDVTDCEPTGTVAEGGLCGNAACADGLSCVGATQATAKCRAMCRANTAADCTGGDTCTPIQGATAFSVCCPAGGC